MPGKRKLRFRSETRQILDLVINSLYTHPDVFLRELVSNASDALDRLRFEALRDTGLLEEGMELRIRLSVDRESRTLTVSDNGIGMTADEMARNLGTIAGSGSRSFLAMLESERGVDADSAVDLIGRFGVGFYSSFMVADEVAVFSRSALERSSGASEWRSRGGETFTISGSGSPSSPGTDVVLHVREGMDEYLDEARLRELVRKYSDYVAYPIVMSRQGDEDQAPLNSMKPLWRRPPDEVSEGELNDFYRHLAGDLEPPLTTISYRAEGATEFNALLFVPSSRPLRMLFPDYRGGMNLYARGILIGEGYEGLLPGYLRFVSGVVECDDLPLNVSRETVQRSGALRLLNRNLTRKVIERLAEVMETSRSRYEEFFESFGDLIKEGIYADPERRGQLADLLLVEASGAEGKPVGLREHAEGLSESDRKDGRLYYLSGMPMDELRRSPHLERLTGEGRQVLLFPGPLDDLVLQVMGSYRGLELVSASRGELDLEPEGDDEAERKLEQASSRCSGLFEYMRDALEGRVKEVRLSRRLTRSPFVLVSDHDDPGPTVRGILNAMKKKGESPLEFERTLEMNPDHPLLETLLALYETDRSGGRLRDYVALVYDLALVADGSRPHDATRMIDRVSELMASEPGVGQDRAPGPLSDRST
ncbi:molecular chaperone HtpG [Candidatus Fermentibacterales bacterium]|nr:molecular chaperone HtpG [Candidatus Fermentibacterales bacterium]